MVMDDGKKQLLGYCGISPRALKILFKTAKTLAARVFAVKGAARVMPPKHFSARNLASSSHPFHQINLHTYFNTPILLLIITIRVNTIVNIPIQHGPQTPNSFSCNTNGSRLQRLLYYYYYYPVISKCTHTFLFFTTHVHNI